MPVKFGSKLNFRTERVTFDVADFPLPYNGILGRPALAKFMAASHYAYNVLKMVGPISVISVPGDKKDALICTDKIYREAAAAAEHRTLAAEAPGGKKKTKSGKSSDAHSGSAPLRSAALPSRTHHRAPPASVRRQWQLHLRPRRCPPRRTALVVLSPSVPRLTLNRKARSLLSCGRMSTCLHGNRLISPVFPGK